MLDDPYMMSKLSSESRIIQLGTSNGDYLNTISIPPFETAPDVLLWGDTIFYRVTSSIYRAAFAYQVIGNGPAGHVKTTYKSDLF